MKGVLDIPTWIKILDYLYRKKDLAYQLEISKKIDVTYSHVSSVIKVLLNDKIVHMKKSGRRRFFGLTPKGKKMGLCAYGLMLKREDGDYGYQN